MPRHVVRLKDLVNQHQPPDDLANGRALRGVGDAPMLHAYGMQAQEILVLREEHAALGRARSKCSSSVAPKRPASGTVSTSTPRCRRPRITALATCSSA